MARIQTDARTEDAGDDADGGSEPERRTQAERRAATQQALLDAAFACLVEDGYANLSTRRVADRAGVSQSNMRHYYPTKVQLISASLDDVLDRLTQETVDGLRAVSTAPDRRIRTLDLTWDVHASDAFRAMIELWVAAVREPELSEQLSAIEDRMRQRLLAAIVELYPDDSVHPRRRRDHRDQPGGDARDGARHAPGPRRPVRGDVGEGARRDPPPGLPTAGLTPDGTRSVRARRGGSAARPGRAGSILGPPAHDPPHGAAPAASGVDPRPASPRSTPRGRPGRGARA